MDLGGGSTRRADLAAIVEELRIGIVKLQKRGCGIGGELLIELSMKLQSRELLVG